MHTILDELIEQSGATVVARDRDTWLAERAKFVTASEAASLIGHGDKSRDVYLRNKVSDKPNYVTAFMQAGTFMERALIDWISADQEIGAVLCPYLLERDGIRGTPDAILMDRRPVEAKYPSIRGLNAWLIEPEEISEKHAPAPKAHFTRLGAAAKHAKTQYQTYVDGARAEIDRLCVRPPMKYWIQLQIQMYLLDAQTGFITAGVFGGRMDWLFERNEVFIGEIVSEIKEAQQWL